MDGYRFDLFDVCVSTTQLDMFDEKTGCQRKWAFRYLAKIKTPQGAGALLGTEVQDTQIDPWLEIGRPIDFSRPSGEIAQAVVPLMPAPQSPGMKIRRKFTMPSATGTFAYIGEIDVWAPDSRIVPGIEGGAPLCGDLKTTKDLQYAKDEEALKTDIQANLYATYLLVADNAEVVDLVWWYSKTRKKYRAQRTHLRVFAPHVAEQFQRIDENAQRLVTAKLANPKPDDLPPNPRMCDDYGGCPYRFACNLSPSIHAEAVNREAWALSRHLPIRSENGGEPTPIERAPAPNAGGLAQGKRSTSESSPEKTEGSHFTESTVLLGLITSSYLNAKPASAPFAATPFTPKTHTSITPTQQGKSEGCSAPVATSESECSEKTPSFSLQPWNTSEDKVNAATPNFIDDLRKQAGAPSPVRGGGPVGEAIAAQMNAAPFPAPPGFVWNGTTFVQAALPAPPATGVAPLDPMQLATAQASGYLPPPPAPVGVIPAAFASPVPPPPPGSIMGAPAQPTLPELVPGQPLWSGPNPFPPARAAVPPAINPPESKLPPAPPVGAAAPAPAAEAPKKRGRPAKAATEGAVTAADVGLGLVAVAESLSLPRPEFAAFLEAWAAKVRAGQ